MEQDSDIVTAIPVLQKQLEVIEKDGKKSRHLLANKEQSKTNSCVLGKYVCEYCDRRFNEYSNLIKHRRIHTGLKPYKCELCGKAFTQSSNLNVHRKRCKGSSVKQTQFTSNQIRKGRNLNCKKKLITKGFQRNQNTVSLNVKKAKDELISIPAKKLALNKCISPKVVEHIKISNFSIHGQLQFEKRRWHENSSITKSENDSSKVSLNCTNLKVFSSRKVSVTSAASLSLSNENEINNKSIQENGLNVSNFRDKQRTHTCEFCNRRFNESSNLIKHRRIHTGQRPYKCTFCGKDFTQSSNLNVHKRICKGQYFSRTSSRLDSSVKSARFSNPKSQNEFTKLPKATRYLSSRTGAFENSSAASQLSCQDSLSTSTWADAMPSTDMFNTSSINGSMSQLYNITSFSPNENQVFPHKYIPFSSAQIENICSEYAENNLDEGSSDGNPILIDPFQTKSDVSQNSENRIQPEENDPNSGSVNQFQCPCCNEAFQNSSLLQKHIQLHTGKSSFGTYSESANQTKQQMIHANNKSYVCEFCQKIFTRSSTLNIHKQTCVKKFGHDTNTSFVSNEGNHYIQELTFNSQNPEDFDCQTVNKARTGSFDKNSPTINNVSHIDYIVIEDESEEDDNSGIRENIQQRVEKDSISSYSVCKTDDLKPAFIKDEPDSLPISSGLIQSEVDTKSVLPEIEPFPSVLEVKQEPIQSEDPIYINVLNVKQEIPDEEYSWNQVCYQPTASGSRLKNGIYDSETAPILETGFSSGELETNDQGSVRENEKLFLENYESNCKLDSQNTSPLNIFKNAPNEKHLSPQSSVKKHFPKLQCPLPSCNGRTFKSASAFQVHIRVHNGQKPYVCEICKKNFNERSNYTKHLRIHSGYKPYKCTQCGRAFTQSSNLNVHKRKCRGLGTFRTTCSSISVGLLKPKTSKANGLNSGLSEYNLTLANASRNNANSTQHPVANIQNNVKFLHSSNCENITRYTCELCGQHFTKSNDLIKHKIIHDIPKPYKCSFCHKAFTQLTNYNLHKATCRRKCNLIKIHDSSVITNSEIKDTENSPENPNALLPSNSDFSIMPDINATSVESDSYPNNSSIYFSKRNELSLTPTENVQQNKEPMVVESFSPLLSVFDNDTRRKVILDQSDENSSKEFKSTSAEVEKPSQPVFLEKNKCRDFEVTNSSLPCDVEPEIRNSSLTDASNQINTNLSSIKKEKSKTVQTKITSKSNANPENVFQCKLHYCRKIFHLASELKEHVKQHRKRGVHVCKFCNKQFNESSNLIKHKRIHTGSKPYKCEFCNKFFSQSSNRNVHRKSCWKSVICNPAVNLDLQCDICLQQFTQISDLYAHKNSCKMKGREKNRNTVQKKSKFNSNFTGKFCKTSKSLVNIREQSIHFKKLNSLAHLSQESSTNIFKSFPTQKHALNGHYMFQCPYSQCGKIFKMASVLRRHIKDHSEKEQYQCEFCCKKFNTSSNLSKHCRIHTGHKPYSCCLCGKLFTQSSNLNVHRKTCSSSTLSSSMNYTSLEKNLAGLDAQNQHGSTEKSCSVSSLHITGIVENSYNISNNEQLLPIETHNQVINIDDETDDDNELNTITPAEKVLSSTISLSQVESDIGAKSCKISSVPSPENILRIEPTHLSVHSKASQLIDTDVIMIEQSQEQNFQVGDTSQKELEAKSKPNKTLNRHLGDDSDNTLVHSVTVKNNSMSLFEATSQIDSGANSNNVYYNSSCSSNQEIKNTSNTSLKSVITLPIYKNNNLKPPIKMSLNNVGNSVTSEKFVLNISKPRSVFSCKVRSCRKVFKSEQELRTHQCKRRTYPCEYCHKRFNESSNLIKHRRIHTGHKPYKCKFCGKTFTQSSNLNVHRKICAKKHSFVEYRFSQHLAHDRNREKSDHVNDDYLEINLSEDSISSVNKSEIAEATTCDVGDFFDQIEGTLSNSPNIPSVSSLVIENSMTITKLEDSVSVKTKVHQDSNIIVENSLTGEVKLQISEKELNAFESKETLPNMTRMAENVLQSENSQDVAQIGYSPNQIPIILKKEVDDGMDSNIIISQCNTEPLETLNTSHLMMDDIYNSSQSVRALTPQLDLVPNSTAQLMHKSSSYAKTMKTGVQLKKYTLTHLKRRTYACEYCKRRFNESSNLIKHRRIHTGLRPYKCQLCGRTFTQSSNRNVHKKICARKNQLSASVVQGHLSLSDNSLSGPKTNRVTKCQKTDILQAHDSDNYCNSDLSLNVDHKTINTVTTSCYASMLSQDAKNDNIESGSPVNDTEPICSISSVTSLRENPDSHLQFLEKKPECFDTNLVQDANPAIQCSRSGNSEFHTSSSTDTNSQQLPFVGGVNSFDTDLSEGSASISHFLNYDNPFSSNTEAAPSNPSHNFEQAFLMCQNQNQVSRKYFQCLFCPRLCKNSADFQRHMRVHTGYKPYKCKICSKLFTDYSNLSKHRRVHTGFKPYKCNLCFKAFSQSSNLNVHKKHCKGIQHNDLAGSMNLSLQSKEVTSSADQIKLNSQASQVLPTYDLLRLKNSIVSTQSDHSSTSRFITESKLSEVKPQSGHLISKQTSISSKSAAQRISLKYLNKMTSRWNKTFSKDSDASECNRFLNPDVPTSEKSTTAIPDAMTFNSTLNNFATPLSKNDSSLQMKNIGLLNKGHNVKVQSNSIIEKTNIYSCSLRNKKSNKQTQQKRHVGLRVRQKHYYCEYCNRKFNEASNLTKHRRIHTGHKPYKCQFCSKRFTQSSNLNVHKKICKSISQNPENPKDITQDLEDKNKNESENVSVFQIGSESQISEKSSKDENLFISSCSTDMKLLVQHQKSQDSMQPKRSFENEDGQNNSVNLPAKISGLTNIAEVSKELSSQKTDQVLLEHKEKNSEHSNQSTHHPKSSVYNEGSSQNSVSSLSNEDIFISSPKPQKCDLLQENSIQNRQLDDLSCSNVMEKEPELSVRNLSSLEKTTFIYESDVKNDQNSLTKVGINNHSVDQKSEISEESSLCTSSSDQNRINNNGLNVEITAHSVSGNNAESAVVRQPPLMILSSQSYNIEKSDNDPGTTELNIKQSLTNYNENLNKSISNDLPELSVLSEGKNCDHSNLHQSAVLNSGLSDTQLKLSQSENKAQVHSNYESKFSSESALKHEDVFSCPGTDIELVQLQSQQPDMLKSIQSAINGILQTEGISSSGDQANQSLLQNATSDWFKIESGYHKTESADLNDIAPSNKNADSGLMVRSVDQINNLDDSDDVIIMDTSADFQSVKTKFNFVEEVQHPNKSSYLAVSQNTPVSNFNNTIEIQSLAKSESVNQLQSPSNTKSITDASLIDTLKTTGFLKSDSEKIISDYQSDVPSARAYNISDQPVMHNDQALLLQVGYPQQQFNSNRFVHDDDVAIIDVKSTLPVKVQTNSNITLSNLNYNPTYFNNSSNVSPAACKRDMDAFSDTITKQTDSRLDHIQESFDYLVPNITDQLLGNSDNKVVETSCQSKQQSISTSPSCVHVCEFCQERFLTPNLLVRHYCPNTGDKPYLCPDCGKAFIQYAAVISHKSTCLKLSVKIADFPTLTNINVNKDDGQAGNTEKDIQASTIDLIHWSGEYNFNSDTHTKMLVPVNQNDISIIPNSEPLSTANRKRIEESYEAKNNTRTSKFVNNNNQLSEFPSQNTEISLNDYDCIPGDHYNDFNSSISNSQNALGNKSHFLDNSYTNNDNSVVDISNILSSAESLPSNNIDSSFTSSTSVALDKLSTTRLPPDNPNLQLHSNKPSLFSNDDFSYGHVNNYRPHNGISNNLDPNVLLKDLAADLSSNQTNKYSLTTPTSSFSSSVHSNTSISASLSSSASSSSTSFINVLDSAVTIVCQYCDKILSLNEPTDHTCSGTTQANRYACSFCEKTLCDASSLSKHLRIHTGHKPYSCGFCGKAFTQSSNLNVHKRICKDKANTLQPT